MENIDDECDQLGIILVKVGFVILVQDLICLFQTNDEILARNLGLSNLPGLVYYENNIPNIYKGDLRIERDVLDWLEEQMNNDEIEEVTDEILDKLIESNDALIAVFCKTLSQ